jgi:uroporphyrin-III C-methyltransferase / precorrin-2 dehydrogenase / sirohydrochlorin ferrochelatase
VIHSLPLFHRIAGQPVIVLGEGEPAAAKRRLVERAGGIVVGEDDAGARLAFVAMGEPAAAAARLKARGLLVNVADRPDLCDFTTPSVLTATRTGGASAGLAKALRLRLEALLPAALGQLADGLQNARGALHERWPDAADRRRALDAALTEGGALDPLSGTDGDAVGCWLHGAGEGALAARHEVKLRSADPDDLTLREARLLGTADTIRHAPDAPTAILARARADAVRIGLDDESHDEGVVVILTGPD